MVDKPDQVWMTDVTFIQTQEGWLCLVVVMDLCVRAAIGWAMDSRMTRELIMSALRMPWFRRHFMTGVLHRIGSGEPVLQPRVAQLLSSYGMTASMSRKGNCWGSVLLQ
ncbi:DDE-type integrase/transposase/recombinase [Chitinilyticum aquatile]|uniref:DDE-type integrase/transposase/recombinase n=1 Tax=Chitinilyticum aquatile TaxID=362520 RepID=UPI0024808593|nr:DDE-type integrase/transposase/recombinase [Chitinilyticum aquatile]